MNKNFFQTKFGNMSYFDNKNLSKETILFIHGLSVSKEIFYKQFIDLQNDFHIIAIDLLGHGESENSADKIKSYSIPGFAESIIELLNGITIKNLKIYGWSIGGQIAIELLARWDGVKKIICDGYPPASFIKKNFEEVYIQNNTTHLMSKKNLTKSEAINYVEKGGIKPNNYHKKEEVESVINSVLRSDGEMRENWFSSAMRMEGISPKECVLKYIKNTTLLIGENDPGIKIEYLKNNFDDICFFFKNTSHAVFWERPDEIRKIILQKFDPLF